MTLFERQVGEGRPQYKIDFGDRKNYRYIPRGEVGTALLRFGLGESRQMVHALYIANDGQSAVGVYQFDEEAAKDHLINNPIFQGVLGPEGIAQTWILWMMFTGQIDDTQTARFAGLEKFHFRHSLYPGATINFALIQPGDNPGKKYGQLLLGSTVLTEGEIEGAIITKEQAERDAQKRKRIQKNTPPLFPFRD